MNRTIRKALALLLAACLALTVCACGADTETPAYTGATALHTNAYGLPSRAVHFEKDEAGNYSFIYMDETAATQTIAAEDMAALMEQTVATCGEEVLTNKGLNLYYQQTLYDFYQQYGSYLSYMMNTAIGLDEQLGMSGTTTWQEDLLTAAFENFYQVAALYQEAKSVDFPLTESSQEFMDTLETGLNDAAVSNGFADATEYLEDTFGPGISFEDYYHFSELNSLAMDYYYHLADQITVDDAALEAYYAENEETFTSQGVKKDDRNVVNVRHILVTVAEDAEESAWDAALQTAEELLQQWKDGEATEESFAALATEKTEDPGSQQTGGLYEGVYPGQMVEPFETWCFDAARQPGDTGIVKTSYGYHVMYFVGQGDYVYWKSMAESYYLNSAASELRAEVTAKYTTESNPDLAVLLEFMAPTVPAAEDETSATQTTDPVEE